MLRDIGEAVEHEEKLCDEVESKGIHNLGDMVSVSGNVRLL